MPFRFFMILLASGTAVAFLTWPSARAPSGDRPATRVTPAVVVPSVAVEDAPESSASAGAVVGGGLAPASVGPRAVTAAAPLRGGVVGGHAGDQKRHVKTARQVAVGDPVGQHKHLVGAQAQTMRRALLVKRAVAVDQRMGGGIERATIGMLGQQDAQLFVAFADGRQRLGEPLIGLAGAALGQRVVAGVVGVDAPAGEHISAGRKAGGHGAACHQHLHTLGAIAQQQNRGRRPSNGGRALGMNELGGSDHGAL